MTNFEAKAKEIIEAAEFAPDGNIPAFTRLIVAALNEAAVPLIEAADAMIEDFEHYLVLGFDETERESIIAMKAAIKAAKKELAP